MDLDNISVHIDKLTIADWQKLFELIPEIESTKEFSTGGNFIEDKDNSGNFIISPEFNVEVVDKLIYVMEELDLIIQFDWSHWDYGKEIFKKGKYYDVDTITCLKLITSFIRADRFSYGAGLASRFEDRTIEKILKTIKKNIDKSKKKL